MLGRIRSMDRRRCVPYGRRWGLGRGPRCCLGPSGECPLGVGSMGQGRGRGCRSGVWDAGSSRLSRMGNLGLGRRSRDGLTRRSETVAM